LLEHQRGPAPARSASAEPASQQDQGRRDDVAGWRPSQVPPAGGGYGSDPPPRRDERSPDGWHVVRPSQIPVRPEDPGRPAGPDGLPVQAKLAVGPAADRYEREADLVADAMVRRMRARPAARADDPGGHAALMDAMEEGFGADLSGVRVHDDSRAHTLSETFRATAFTSGRDIFLGRAAAGLPASQGQRLVAHELTHVLQQGATVGLPLHHTAAALGASPLIQRAKAPADLVKAREQHDKAVATHKAQSRILAGWLTEGSQSKDDRLANSCEWIIKGLSKLYAATRTGDSTMRVITKGGNYDKVAAYFPEVAAASEPGDIYNAEAGYDYNDLENNAGIRFHEISSKGWNATQNTPTAIAVTNVPTAIGRLSIFSNVTRDPLSKEEFFTILKHEVQHAADRHRIRKDEILNQATALQTRIGSINDTMLRLYDALQPAMTYDVSDLGVFPPNEAAAYQRLHTAIQNKQKEDPADLKIMTDFQNAVKGELLTGGSELDSLRRLEEYKAEYRAYSYQGTYDKYDNVQDYDTSVPSSFRLKGRPWTKRQYKIFSHIYETYPDIKAGWDANATVQGRSFRREVIDYRDPDVEGVNKLNSVRVDDVYDKLRQIPHGTNAVDQQKLTALKQSIAALRPAEKAYLRNKAGDQREFTRELTGRIADQSVLAGLETLLES
jgi:hypothetical protein